MLRSKVTSCRVAWDEKSFDYLRDALQTLAELHDRWSSSLCSFRQTVRAPFHDATPMERQGYEADHWKWLSGELDAWHALFPAIRRFAKRKDPKCILSVQKVLRLLAELGVECQKLGRSVNVALDAQMMEYFHYHPPQIAQTA